MAREFDGTDDTCQFNPGNAAGVHAYGTVAVLFKRTGASGASWRCPIYTGTGSTSNWGLSFDINTGNVMWFGLGTGESTGSTALNTTNWYLVIAVKPNGSGQTVRFHVRSHNGTSWGSWTHSNGSGTVNNAASPSVSTIYIGSFAGFDYFNGRIAAAAVYEQWAPNDAAIEAIDWHLAIQEWVDAAASSTGAWVICPGQGGTGTPIQDLIGSGHETTSGIGTVADDPPGFDVNLDTGEILLEASAACTSSFSAQLVSEKELEADITVASSFSAQLVSRKNLSTSISIASDFLAEMQVANEMAALVDSVSTFSAEMTQEIVLAAEIDSASTLTAQLVQEIVMFALATPASTFTANLPAANQMQANISASSTLSAEMHIAKEMFAIVEATSTFMARIDLGQPTPFNAAAQVILWGRNRWFDPQFIDRSVPSGYP